jgi:hypothetical protein
MAVSEVGERAKQKFASPLRGEAGEVERLVRRSAERLGGSEAEPGKGGPT